MASLRADDVAGLLTFQPLDGVCVGADAGRPKARRTQDWEEKRWPRRLSLRYRKAEDSLRWV